ncbi:hypothetical protein IJI31_00495 [bacterium]|nr:hypothetical protein [bacterium]
MRIAPINNSNFKANVWVDKNVKGVVAPNREAFDEAVGKYQYWLQTAKRDVPYTMNIRENSSLYPDTFVSKETYDTHEYPYEECGYTVTREVHHTEDLEFEINGKKGGFWFNPNASADQLLDSFKSMFDNLNNK